MTFEYQRQKPSKKTSTAKGLYRWRLKADNGEIIADSAEAYVNQADCLHAIKLVRGCKDAGLTMVTRDGKFHVKRTDTSK